jgi:hypothetical protein
LGSGFFFDRILVEDHRFDAADANIRPTPGHTALMVS